MLGVLLPQRSPAAPNVPTMSEAGLPAVAVPTWQAIFAPPKMTSSIVDRLARATNSAVEDAEVRQQFEKLLLQPGASTAERLRAIVARDVETWRVFVRENDIPQE
jgi:tripartite-type tricarboxylate transporter receptor subunit TctC